MSREEDMIFLRMLEGDAKWALRFLRLEMVTSELLELAGAGETDTRT